MSIWHLPLMLMLNIMQHKLSQRIQSQRDTYFEITVQSNLVHTERIKESTVASAIKNSGSITVVSSECCASRYRCERVLTYGGVQHALMG